MDTRLEAEEAIHRWRREFGLLQKDLAKRAKVLETTISHIVHEPGWTASQAVYQRICDVVEAEAACRIALLPMKVIALCQSDTVVFQDAGEAVLRDIRKALMQLPTRGALDLPEGIKGALVQLGHDGSGLMLIAISASNSNEERQALAHELEH